MSCFSLFPKVFGLHTSITPNNARANTIKQNNSKRDQKNGNYQADACNTRTNTIQYTAIIKTIRQMVSNDNKYECACGMFLMCDSHVWNDAGTWGSGAIVLN